MAPVPAEAKKSVEPLGGGELSKASHAAGLPVTTWASAVGSGTAPPASVTEVGDPASKATVQASSPTTVVSEPVHRPAFSRSSPSVRPSSTARSIVARSIVSLLCDRPLCARRGSLRVGSRRRPLPGCHARARSTRGRATEGWAWRRSCWCTAPGAGRTGSARSGPSWSPRATRCSPRASRASASGSTSRARRSTSPPTSTTSSTRCSTRTSPTSCCSGSPTAGSWSPERCSTSPSGSATSCTSTPSCPTTATACSVSPGARSRLIQLGDAWLVPPYPRSFDDPVEAEWATARRTPHPIGCFTEPVRLLQPLEEFPFSRTYIRATADEPDAPGTAVFEAIAARARIVAGLGLRRDRHQPHDPEQPPARAGRRPPGDSLWGLGHLAHCSGRVPSARSEAAVVVSPRGRRERATQTADLQGGRKHRAKSAARAGCRRARVRDGRGPLGQRSPCPADGRALQPTALTPSAPTRPHPHHRHGDALALGSGRLFVGGEFTAPRFTRLGALDPATGAVVWSASPAVPSEVRALVVVGTRLFAGGDFGVRVYDTATGAQLAIVHLQRACGLWSPMPPTPGWSWAATSAPAAARATGTWPASAWRASPSTPPGTRARTARS